MWHLGTWVSGRLGNVGLTAGLHDLKCCFWPKWFFQGKRAEFTHWSKKLGVLEPPWPSANKNTHSRDGHPEKQPLRNPTLTDSMEANYTAPETPAFSAKALKFWGTKSSFCRQKIIILTQHLWGENEQLRSTPATAWLFRRNLWLLLYVKSMSELRQDWNQSAVWAATCILLNHCAYIFNDSSPMHPP